VFVVETSLVLPHPAAAVFGVAADLRLAPRWRKGVADVADGAAGEPPTVAFRVLRGRHALATRMTACLPPRFVAWEGRAAEFQLELSLWLESAPGGGTRVTYHCALALEAADVLPARQVTALRRLLARRAPRDLERLAMLVEELAPAVAA
jgi:hypothetical protein